MDGDRWFRMRTFIFDAFEFDEPHSEQRLEVAISRRSDWPHSKVEDFVGDVARCAGTPEPALLPAPVSFVSSPTFSTVSRQLERFSLLNVPFDCRWRCFVIADEWNDLRVVLDTGDLFVSFKWDNTA